MTRSTCSNRGFTLVEVLIALSLLGLTMATVVALFSSGMQLRRVTRERLTFDRDARLLVEALRDDLANLVPAGPPPMITADSIVLWRQQQPSTMSSLVTYQWSGSADQESLLVRLATPMAIDVVDLSGVQEEFLRWARVFDPTAITVPPLIREDHGTRFGSRASLNGLAGSWVAFPGVRAAAWGLCDGPGVEAAEGTSSRILVRLSPRRWTTDIVVPDPAVRLALIPQDGIGVTAALWLPIAAQAPVDLGGEQAEAGAS